MIVSPLTLSSQLTSISFKDAVTVAVIGFLIVIFVLAILALFVKFLSFIVNSFSKNRKKQSSVKPVQEKQNEFKAKSVSPSPSPSPYITLDGVSEQEAAVIMAITADKLKKPLKNLDFKSIKRLGQAPELVGISEQDAAVVMAVTADKLKKPLKNLEFKSIRLLED